MRHNDRHPTDQELLLLLDRELPSRRQAPVEAHLARCVFCQTRRAQIDHTARGFAELYQRDVASRAGRPGGARERLRWQLNRMADDWGGSRRVRLLSALMLTPRWVTVGAAVVATVLFIRVARPFQPVDPRSAVAPVERDALPVASLTPGATWNLSAGELCAGGAREPRQIPAAVRQQVLRGYGMEDVPEEEYELDYLITPELGGSPDPRNLWPQRYTSRSWNAHVKDQLERLLPQLVCDRQVALETAQRDIANDWIAAYKKYFKTDTPLQTQANMDESGPPGEGVAQVVFRSGSSAGL